MDCDDDSFGYFHNYLALVIESSTLQIVRTLQCVIKIALGIHPSLLPRIFTLYGEHGISFLLYSILMLRLRRGICDSACYEYITESKIFSKG